MASDGNDRVDEVVLNMNADGTVDMGYENLPTLKKPGESGTKAAWSDYCIALGTDSAATADLTKPALVDLADRLGG